MFLSLAALACSSPETTDLTTTSIFETTTIVETTTTTSTSNPPVTTLTTWPPTAVPTTTLPPVIGAPYGEVNGITMFRGNPSRTFYGTGPIPDSLEVAWRFPDSAMCGVSSVGSEDVTWCGSGWTGQPVVWERPDGMTEVIVGTYDKNIHFVNAATGERTRPDFPMGDIIKGSVTLDPNGFPLLYSGSRDSDFKIIALDREVPTLLWSLAADSVPGIWNNDWDSNPVLVDGVLYQGGENSWWFAIELNRAIGADGLVTIDPEIVFDMPAFTPELRSAVGNQQSIESSTAVFEGRAYFANSAGRIVGVDVSALPDGEATVEFDFWVGDDVDATIVIDQDGALYVSAEVDHDTATGRELGQLIKLDPSTPHDPVVWGIPIPGVPGADGGIWATPALAGSLLYVATNPGELLAVDTNTGAVLWSDDIGPHAWSSPVVIGDRLLVATDCETGGSLRIYDISIPDAPSFISDNRLFGGCVESTPAVWNGDVFVGSRDGFLYGLTTAEPAS